LINDYQVDRTVVTDHDVDGEGTKAENDEGKRMMKIKVRNMGRLRKRTTYKT
jgi:hypothetical protein